MFQARKFFTNWKTEDIIILDKEIAIPIIPMQLLYVPLQFSTNSL